MPFGSTTQARIRELSTLIHNIIIRTTAEMIQMKMKKIVMTKLMMHSSLS